MKLSRFIILFERDNLYFLYNTSTQSFIKLRQDDYQNLSKVISGEMNIANLNEELLDFLKEKQCIDTDDDQQANDFCVKMEYRKRFASFSGRTLSLVIAPTLACNFACPYCYESDLPNTAMTEEVEDNVIKFIKSYEKTCDNVEICWDGGEPLVAFETIKSIYEKIETQTSLDIINHLIVTNGYLLTPEICSFFKEKKLDLAQITIDGTPKSHNKSRILKSGQPTYDTIVKNIDMLTEMVPDCMVVVRTNIHNGNKDEYVELYNNLTHRWEGRNIRISPSFVLGNNNCKVSCCSPREKSEFYLQLQKHNIIKKSNILPKLLTGSCTATAENSYVIDPRGCLYKCWNDIGQDKLSVGNVEDGIKNNTLIAKYVVGSDKYSDKECLKCKLFPICEGGCNRHRIDNRESGTHYSLCSFDEEGICNNLYEYYKELGR